MSEGGFEHVFVASLRQAEIHVSTVAFGASVREARSCRPGRSQSRQRVVVLLRGARGVVFVVWVGGDRV